MSRDLTTNHNYISRALQRIEKQTERRIQFELRNALEGIRADLGKMYEKAANAQGKLGRTELMKYGRLQTLEKQVMARLEPALRFR